MSKFDDGLNVKFQISDIIPTYFFLNIILTQNQACQIFCLDKQFYLKNILEDYRISHCQAIAILINGIETL